MRISLPLLAFIASAGALQFTFERTGVQRFVLGQDVDPTIIPSNETAFYQAQLLIGSGQRQWVDVQVDFNSLDMWVIADHGNCGQVQIDYFTTENYDNQVVLETATATSSTPGRTYLTKTYWSDCLATAEFNPLKLSLFKWNNTNFKVGYHNTQLDFQREVKGKWGRDKVSLATQQDNLTVLDLLFGVANFSEFPQGQLGLGLPILQSTYMGASDFVPDGYQYPDFLGKLKSQGVIKKRLYLVYCPSIDGGSRAILFGAVNTKKFQGNLTTLPMIMTNESARFGQPTMMQVAMTGMSVTTLNKKPYVVTHHTYPTVFNLGQRWTILPHALHAKLLEVLNLKDKTDLTLPCEIDGTIRVQFNFGGGAQLDMPVNDLIRRWNNKCQLGVYSHSEPYVVLGDNVLRRAYVVYDQEKFEILLAPIMYTPETDTQMVGAGKPVPGALLALNYEEVGQIYTVLLVLEDKPRRSVGNLLNHGYAVGPGFTAWIAALVMLI